MKKVIAILMVTIFSMQFFIIRNAEAALIPAFTENVGFNDSFGRVVSPPLVVYTYSAPNGYIISAGNFTMEIDDNYRGTSVYFYGDGDLLCQTLARDGRYTRTPSFNGKEVNEIEVRVTSADGGWIDAEGELYLSVDIADNSAVKDSSGTVLQAARSANNAANTAKSAAETASTNAEGAKKSADTAKNILNGTSNGGKSLAATYDIAANIRNTQLPNIENKIANLETTINNINSDTTAPTVKVKTVSGARATSANSIQSMVAVTDNSSGPFEYRVNSGSWAVLPDSGQVVLPVTQPGMNPIIVELRDPSGNIGKDVITIRKL